MRSSQIPLTSVERHCGPLETEVVRSRKSFQSVSYMSEMIEITASEMPSSGTKVAKIGLREKSNVQGWLFGRTGR